VITNNSVEATVRAGGDLGLAMYLVEDACFTFGKGRWTAQDVHEMSVSNLEREYATITTSARVLTGYLESLFAGPAGEGPLRAAEAAKKAKVSDATVLAALLWAGRGLVPAALLRPLAFGEGVCSLVEQRGQMLRYLAAREGGRQGLSGPDLQEVERLGGPLNETEAEIFGDLPSTFTLLRLRQCEEQAKVAGPAPAGFAAYRTMLESHLNGTPSQQA
jgi:hypothetical protein